MTCTIANQLREKWYATTIVLNGQSSVADKNEAMRRRGTKEYKEAMDEYMEHRIDCKACQKEWVGEEMT